MARTLTKKQRGFVKDYVKTGIGSLAVKENYDVANDETARVIASENLTKPNIVKAIADRLPDDLLTERHLELLNKRDTFTFKKSDDTVESVDLGPEVQAVTKGLDMAYKLKGSYAETKSIALNVNVEGRNPESIEIQTLRREYEEKLRAKLT